MSDAEVVTLERLEEWQPTIPWRRPLTITVPGVGTSDFACRVCIAQVGIVGHQIVDLPKTRDEWDAHFRAVHGAEPEQAGG